MIKHNCYKECDFEWIVIALEGMGTYGLKCNLCGRIFSEIDEEDLK